MLESLFNKVASRQACNIIKNRSQHRCFPINFVKLLPVVISNMQVIYRINQVSFLTTSCTQFFSKSSNFRLTLLYTFMVIGLDTMSTILSQCHLKSYLCNFQDKEDVFFYNFTMDFNLV